jgi:hypothetical protein
MCRCTPAGDGEGLVDIRAFEDLIAEEDKLEELLRFFDGLNPDDLDRLRWDRLVAFQLVLMAFIETFGYEIHKTDQKWFDAVARRMRPEVATNLMDWLPKLGIGKQSRFHRTLDPGGRRAIEALKKVALPEHINQLRQQAKASEGADPQA